MAQDPFMIAEEQGQYRRRVGAVRPSHLMFTAGVGSLVDLPSFSALIQGIDEWDYRKVVNYRLEEPRLLAAVQRILGPSVKQLRTAPWLTGLDRDPDGEAARVGVPTLPFPQWLRCTACNLLAPLANKAAWKFENDIPRRPDLARFFHDDCPSKRKNPLAVTARFMLSCTDGHLDEFPYTSFVHQGGPCVVARPTLSMRDHGGNQGANVTISCENCKKKSNINNALGVRGEASLPRCRGRHPHLGVFEAGGCRQQARLLIVGASNQWFAQTLSALAVPEAGASGLALLVEQLWRFLDEVEEARDLRHVWKNDACVALREWPQEQVFEAIGARRARLAADPTSAPEAQTGYADLLSREWDVFTAEHPPPDSRDFALRRTDLTARGDDGPSLPATVFSDVQRVERLREVRALIGFTRLDAPDRDDPNLVKRVRLSRSLTPEWVPATEVRGEGIFLRVDEDLLAGWEARVHGSASDIAHRRAYENFQRNRYSDRIRRNEHDWMRGWPGLRYIALHTLSHLLINTIAKECGYSGASLTERIYSTANGNIRSGILIYTAVPDSEGSLGGLVALGRREPLERILRRALREACQCSSDPLCAERLPQPQDDFLHGAACHACAFVSETTCEKGNRFLDRRFIVPLCGEDKLALIPEFVET